MMLDRFRAFSVWIVVLAVSCTLFLERTVFAIVTSNPYFRMALVWMGGILTYQLLTKLLFAFGAKSPLVLAAFYGKTYLDGFWHYTSRCGGQLFLGVWHIEQDLYETRLVAFGLDDRFGKRSAVQSVACTLRPERLLFVNERTDFAEDPTRGLFSKTTLVSGRTERRFLLLKHPVVLLGETELFGGARSGQVNTNVVLRKHPEVDSFEDLIRKLRGDADLWADQR